MHRSDPLETFFEDMSSKVGHPSTGLRLTEHLTDYTRELQSKAADIVGYYNATVIKTKVYAKHNGMNFKIKCQKDIDDLRTRVNNMRVPTDIAISQSSPSPNNDLISTPLSGRSRGNFITH